ncbi:malate dehydrogenase (oxaloacetate-decarboxylating) [Caloramator fervidus]|uniref:Malate dehydrogenase (Oxaloacetate-decarboxylating) n=1 Tax=Caloramator fervidus TaxID=29344 RepID=A0A1H5WP05_9CLOT|nr:malic enzyme-like NAD(P)-binding protein [Caloramator fervidus]SEG01090.1 malate dehydrogenase (oxaloacetate-decarboxylating) [Caloramator fervidus]
MSIYDEALKFHEDVKGKIEVISRVEVSNSKELSLAYTPGVAQPCIEIHKDPDKAYKYTRKWNTIAVISDGSAVLGLGDIGPLASLPVMEGKCVLFKKFADVDAFPIVIDSKDVDEIVETIVKISKSFGGINLEDISAPRCFEIEEKLKERLDIPVFHDDQHGTAIVTLAALKNALKIVGKKIENIKIIVNGAGAAGTAITKLLLKAGAKNIIVCDKKGVLDPEHNLDKYKLELSKITNPNKEKGLLKDVIKGADVFIGVSAPYVLTKDMVKSMNKDAIVFAMANPTPEIFPDEAKEAGARIIGTGRSDFENQINNVLAFPGVFRGALDARAKKITDDMKLAAAEAIANFVKEDELNENYIIPKAFNLEVQKKVAEAVYKAAIK